jgi:hypothetical protein
MSHVDSGTLHAYLDGERGAVAGEVEAHLAQCAECRALLAEARRVRDRAKEILDESGPRQVVTPPFADILARAARQRTRRSNRPLVMLAWAASLVLAVTVGWYARNLAVTRQPEKAAAKVAATREEPRVTGIEARAPAPRQVAQATPARADTAPTKAEAAGAGAGPAPTTTMVPAQNQPVADVAPAEAKGAVEPTPSPVAAPEPALRRTARNEARLQAEEAWVAVSPTEAARRLGGPLATIPGLPSLGTSVSGAGGSVVARTTLVLGPGQTIELVQQRMVTQEQVAAPPAPAALPQAGAGLRDKAAGLVSVRWKGFSVSGRALVPEDSLRRLLQRLTAAGSPQ